MHWVANARWNETWKEVATLEGGGQAAAKRAERVADGQEGFLKILSRNKDIERRARFFREATAYSMFDHRGIPRLLESNAHLNADPSRALYIATEWIEGPTLRKAVEGSGMLTLADGVVLISAVLEILEVCHREEVVHRDVKPDNLILRLGRSDAPVLLDFGLTFHERSAGDFQTEHGQEVGNRFLRLPELSANSPIKTDVRSDLTFAAGLLLYVLTSQHPDILMDGHGRLPHQRDGIYDAVRSAGGEHVARLLGFFDTAFQPRVSERFSSATEMKEALLRMTTLKSPGGDDDLTALRALVDTTPARQATEAVERFSTVLRFAWSLHEPLIRELGDTLELVQSKWDVDAEAGRITLAFKRKGEVDKFLSNTFVVQQAGDELTLIAAGEPILRTDAVSPNLDDSARQSIRSFLIRRLESALNRADPLPPEAELLETEVSPSLARARERAATEQRPIYAIYYDSKERERGGLDYGITQYFGTRKARTTLARSFIVAMVTVADAAAADASLAGRSMEKARWAIFDSDLQLKEDGILDRNANDGEAMIERLAARYQS